MRLLFILLMSFWIPQKQETVLICKSGAAYAYHNKKCQGLRKCTHVIERIALEEAIKIGRTPCGYCYTSSETQPASQTNGQCKAITKKGTRCSRRGGSNGYCWQHGGG